MLQLRTTMKGEKICVMKLQMFVMCVLVPINLSSKTEPFSTLVDTEQQVSSQVLVGRILW